MNTLAISIPCGEVAGAGSVVEDVEPSGVVVLPSANLVPITFTAYGKEGQEAINGETGSPATCPPSLTVPTFCVGLVNPDVGETVSIPVSV